MQIEHRMDAKRGNLIWLSDGRTEAAAALDFGIRIVHLSCAGKPNLFYSQPASCSRTASACGSGPTPGPALKRRSSCAFCRTGGCRRSIS